MKITSATSTEHVSSILLPDLDAVKAALVMFNQGTRGSNATNQRLIADGGGMAAMMLTLVHNPGRFLEMLFNDMDEAFASRSVYDRHFDYDGPGPFFKNSVRVNRLENGSFMLSLHAAYVGHQVEEGLAEALNVQRGLWWNHITLTFDAPKGDQFTIDFDPIAAKLASFSGRKLAGAEIAEKIVAGTQSSYETTPTQGGHFLVRMGSSKGPSLGISISEMSVESFRKRPFTQNGSLVIGGLVEDNWQTPEIMRQPQVVIDILGHREYGGDYPVFDAKMQEMCRQTAELVLDRFTTP